MPLAFDQVYDLYRKANDSQVLPPGTDLNSFAQLANTSTNSNDFDEGRGGFIGQNLRKASYWIDQGLQATGAPQALGQAGRSAFEAFGGSGDVGQQVGQSIPRGIADFAPMIGAGIATAVAPEAMIPAWLGGAGLGATSALSALHTYGETGSPGRSAISAMLPYIGGVAGEAAGGATVTGLGKLGVNVGTDISNPIVDQATGQLLNQTGTQLTKAGQVAHFVGSQLGAIPAMEGVQDVSSIISNYREGKPLNPYGDESVRDWVLSTVLGNAPYAIMGATHLLGPQIMHEEIGPHPLANAPKLGPATHDEAFNQAYATVEAQHVQDLASANMLKDPAAKKVAIQTAIDNKLVAKYAIDVQLGDKQTPPSQAFTVPENPPNIQPPPPSQAFDLWQGDQTPKPQGGQQPSQAFDLWTHPDDIKTPVDIASTLGKVQENAASKGQKVDLSSIRDNVSTQGEMGIPPADAVKNSIAAVANEASRASEHAQLNPAPEPDRLTSVLSNWASSLNEQLKQGVQTVYDVIGKSQFDPETLDKVGAAAKKWEVEGSGDLGKLKSAVSTTVKNAEAPDNRGGLWVNDKTTEGAQGKGWFSPDRNKAELEAVEANKSLSPAEQQQSRYQVESRGRNGQEGFTVARFFKTKEGMAEHKASVLTKIAPVVESMLPKNAKGDPDAKIAEVVKTDNLKNILRAKTDEELAGLWANVTKKTASDRASMIESVLQSLGNPAIRQSVKDKIVENLNTHFQGEASKVLTKIFPSVTEASTKDGPTQAQLAARAKEKNSYNLQIKTIERGDPVHKSNLDRFGISVPENYEGFGPKPDLNFRKKKETAKSMSLGPDGELSSDQLNDAYGATGDKYRIGQSAFQFRTQRAIQEANGKNVFGIMPDKEGNVKADAFLAKTNQLPPFESETVKATVAALRDENGKVNLKQLAERLGDVAKAKVGFHVLETNNDTPVMRERALVIHKLDTLFPGWTEHLIYPGEKLPLFDEENGKISLSTIYEERFREKWNELATRLNAVPHQGQSEAEGESATARFTQVNPKEPRLMIDAADLTAEEPRSFSGKGEISQHLPDQPKFEEHSHFPTRKNVIGFARTHVDFAHEDGTSLSPSERTELESRIKNANLDEFPKLVNILPLVADMGIKPVLKVFEVQSDWAAKRSKQIKRLTDKIATMQQSAVGKITTEQTNKILEKYRAEVKELEKSPPENPLLPSFEPLLMKAAIERARQLGIDMFVVSDAESAMMTEQHDQHSENHNAFVTVEDQSLLRPGSWGLRLNDGRIHVYPFKAVAEQAIPQINPEFKPFLDQVKPEDLVRKIEQSKGMRAAYDNRLPNIAKKLTGEEGQSWDGGEHQNARTGEEGPENDPSGSPVFTQEDGMPKTNDTGRIFSLAKPLSEISQHGAQLLAGKTSSLNEQLLGHSPETGVMSFGDVIGKVLTKLGFTNKQIEGLVPFYTKVQNIADLDHVKFGELINDELKGNKTLLGLSQMGDTQRRIWLAAFKNGSKEDAARLLGWTLAHEGGHAFMQAVDNGLADAKSAQAVHELKALSSQNPDQMADLLKTMVDLHLPSDLQKLPEVQEMLANRNPDEMMANVRAVWTMGKMAGDDGLLGSLMIPREGRNFLSAITQFARKIIGAVKSALWTRGDTASDMMKKQVADLVKTFDDGQGSINAAESKVADIMKLYDSNSDGWSTLRSSALEVLEDTAQTADMRQLAAAAVGGAPGPKSAWDKFKYGMMEWFGQLQNMADTRPEMKRAATHILDRDGRIHMSEVYMKSPLYGGYDESNMSLNLNGPEAKEWDLVQNNGKLAKLRDDILTWGQKDENIGERIALPDLETKNPAFFQRAMELKDSDRSAVFNTIDRLYELQSRAGEKYLETSDQITRNVISTYLAGKLPELHPQIASLVDSLKQGFDMLKTPDPQVQAIAGQLLGQARTSLGADNYLKALEMLQTAQKGKDSMANKFAQRPGFMSRRRYGNLKVEAPAQKGLPRDTVNASNMADVEQWKANMRKKGYETFKDVKDISTYKPATVDMIPDDMINLIDQHEATLRDMINSTDMSDEAKAQLLDAVDIKSDIMQQSLAKELVKGPTRDMIAGDLDMGKTQLGYASEMSRLLANKLMRTGLAYEMQNPALLARPDMIQLLKKALQNYLTPDSKLGRALSTMQAVYFLGLNVPAHLMQLLHPFMSMMPEVINRTGWSAWKATRHVSQVQKDVAAWKWNIAKSKISLGAEGDAIGKWKSSDERSLLKWAAEQGAFHWGGFSDMPDRYVDSSIAMAHRAELGTSQKAWEAAKKPIKNFADWSMKSFTATINFNLQSSLIAGYRIAKSQGLTGPKAFDAAKDFMRATTYHGGKANRPIAPFQGDYKLVGHLAYGLQTYTLGWLGQLTRYMMHWNGDQYAGFSDAQKTNARRAATNMLGVKLAAAGALGLPFMGAALKLLENVTGEDIKGNAYLLLSKLLGEDEENGAPLTNVIMRGGANAMLAQAGLPIDIGSKLGVSGVLGMNDYDGFSGNDVFGPTASMVSAVSSGLKDLSMGQYQKLAKDVAPPAYKKMLDYWLNGERITDSNGAPISSTPTDDMAYMVGFTPQSVRAIKDAQAIKKQQAVQSKMEQAKTISDLVDTFSQDPGEAKQKLDRTVADSEGLYTVKGLAQSVAAKLAQAQFPEDPREGLARRDADHNMAVARILGVPLPEAHEVEKQNYTNEILRMLGGRPTLGRASVFNQQFDQGMSQSQNPYQPASAPTRGQQQVAGRGGWPF